MSRIDAGKLPCIHTKTRKSCASTVANCLATLARNNLAQTGIVNADVRTGDGSQETPSEGPFDAIVLSGSVAEVPQHLLNQLKLGGQLIAIVGQEPVMQATLTQRVSEQQWRSRALWDICVPALVGFPQPSRFKF